MLCNGHTAVLYVSISDAMPGPRRHERVNHGEYENTDVSISDEMPGPWRRSRKDCVCLELFCFNLRRDARPLATSQASFNVQSDNKFQSQTRCQAPGDLQE